MYILRTQRSVILLKSSFFVLALLVALFLHASFFESLLVVAVLFCTFLVHELGHIIVSFGFSHPTQTVISGTGGRTEVLGFQLSTWKKILVYLGGIVASYIAAVCTGILLNRYGDMGEVLQACLYFFYTATIGYLLINLIPLYPFDCGEMIVDLAATKFGRKGERCAACFCGFFAALSAVYVVINGGYLALIICLYSINQCYGVYTHTRFSKKQFSEEKMFLHHLCKQWDLGDHEKILQALSELESTTSDPDIQEDARAAKAGFYMKENKPNEAFTILSENPEGLSLSGLEYLQLAAYKTSHWYEALEAGKRAFTQEKTAAIASLCALCAARLLREKEAVEWIISAQNLGLESMEDFLKATDFEGIQDTPIFQDLQTLLQKTKK